VKKMTELVCQADLVVRRAAAPPIFVREAGKMEMKTKRNL
jgi:hypothetical protein